MGARRKAVEPSEKQVQAAIVDHWRTFRLPDTLVAAIPNARAFGQPGLTPGLPDLLVMGPRVPCGVGFIELKRTLGGRMSKAQIEIQNLCARLGVQYWIAGRDSAIGILENWGIVKPQARRAA